MTPDTSAHAALRALADHVEARMAERTAATELQSLILRHSSEGVILRRISDDTLLFVSPRLEAMFGFDAGEMQRMPVSALRRALGGPTAEERKAPFEKQLREEGSLTFDALCYRKDGTPLWVRIATTRIEHLTHGPLVLSLHEDIHATKTAEHAVAVAERKYRSLFETAHDAIVVVDQSGTIQMANPMASRMFDYAPDALIGQAIELLIPENLKHDHVAWRQRFQTTPCARSMGGNLDLVARRRDGSLFAIDVALSVSHAEADGAFVTAIIRDMSARKAAENQQKLLARVGQVLAESLELAPRLQAAAQVLAESLCDWLSVDLILESGSVQRIAAAHKDDSQPELLERLQKHRPTPLQVNGIRRCLAEGKAMLCSDMDRPGLERALAQEPETLRLFQDMGTRSYMMLPMIAHGRALGVVSLTSARPAFAPEDLAFCQVVVDRIAVAADNARLYEEAKQAIRSREDVVAIVSHDLMNPLSALKFTLPVLLRTIEADPHLSHDGADLREIIQSMDETVGRALSLSADLLVFGKMQAGRFAIDAARADPRSLVAEALQAFVPRAQMAEIVLDAVIADNVVDVFADRKRCVQALGNLLGNALKFTGRSGRIRIEVSQLDEADVLFAVRDSGSGIPAEALPHLFDRYWQPEATRQQGTGLGLAIVKNIVEAHRGRIWIESTLDVGSVFSFTIPVFQTH